ncbi:hypothetical protein TNCV_2926181 [Trichonephila clavipes]|nr:hypothetical protein TNCV_2926181 [Trichonephila clavipes]
MKIPTEAWVRGCGVSSVSTCLEPRGMDEKSSHQPVFLFFFPKLTSPWAGLWRQPTRSAIDRVFRPDVIRISSRPLVPGCSGEVIELGWD